MLIVQADRGPVTLVSAIGYGEDPPAMVVVNERTTVATGNAFAQFINGRRVVGNAVGMLNAVRMAGNLAHPVTGDAGLVVSRTPNGGENSTFATFNSLANAVAACVAKDFACVDLQRRSAAWRRRSRQRVAGRGEHRQVRRSGYPNDQQIGVPSSSPLRCTSLPFPTPDERLLFLKITCGFYSAQDSNT